MDSYIQKSQQYSNDWDHRKLGQELGLFSFHEAGPGMPFFLPRGLALKNRLIHLWREQHSLPDYQEIQSPIMLDRRLWERSGHWDLYKENMYVSEVEKRMYAIKPMNCPGAILHFQEKRRSFRELPLRVCELGQVHREEKSGALHGLLRVRSFMVDDVHIFCGKDHLFMEIRQVLELSQALIKKCGFEDFHWELSIRDSKNKEKYLGEDKDWNFAEQMLEQALEECGLPYSRKEGEAKFYGPAIDLKIQDSVGRKWQCSSLQMDFNLAHRFDLNYFDKEGQKAVPYILHRCIFGSLERFIAILLEHHKGLLPLWLAPFQARLISVSGAGQDSLERLSIDLQKNGIRFEADFSDRHISEKMKKAKKQKIPILIIAGDKEAKNNLYSVYRLSDSQQSSMNFKGLIDQFKE